MSQVLDNDIAKQQMVKQPSDDGKDTLMKILGYNLNSSAFTKSMMFEEGRQQNILSTATQQGITAGQVVTITLANDQIVNLNFAYLCGLFIPTNNAGVLTRTNVPINMLAAFKPISIQFGGATYTMNQGEYYQQIRLALKNPAEMKPYSDCMWLPTDLDSDSDYLSRVDGVTKNYGLLKQATWLRSASRKDYNFAIPLTYLFPMLQDIVDGGLYTNMNQPVKLTLQTAPYVDIMIDSIPQAVPVIDGQYRIDNMQMFYQYTPLDGFQSDAILQRSLQFELIDYVHTVVPVASQANTFTTNLSPGDKARRLMFILTSNQPRQARPITNAASLYQNELSSRLFLWPKVAIKQILLTIDGHQINLNATIISMLNLTSQGSTYNTEKGYAGQLHNGMWGDLHHVYSIDLSRLPSDLWGSTGQKSVIITCTISIDPTGTPSTTGGIVSSDLIATTDNSDSSIGVNITNFSIQAFIEKQVTLSLENGIYKNK